MPRGAGECGRRISDSADPQARVAIGRVFRVSNILFAQTLQHVRGGIEYRKNNPYLKLAHENKEYPLEQEVRKWTAADYHNTTLDGGPVHVIRAGLANVSGLYSSLSVKDIVEEMTLKKEEAYIMCDRVTRESGRLTKQIVIMDFANQGNSVHELEPCLFSHAHLQAGSIRRRR